MKEGESIHLGNGVHLKWTGVDFRLVRYKSRYITDEIILDITVAAELLEKLGDALKGDT